MTAPCNEEKRCLHGAATGPRSRIVDRLTLGDALAQLGLSIDNKRFWLPPEGVRSTRGLNAQLRLALNWAFSLRGTSNGRPRAPPSTRDVLCRSLEERAMADTFAKIGDIKGDSRDRRHAEEIDVLSWSWGLSQASAPIGAGGTAPGRASFRDFTFIHQFDKASPVLMRTCATGQHVRDATITVRKAGQGQQEYLVIKMTDVVITGVTPTAAGDGAPAETVSLQCGRVDVEYRPQRADGSVDAPTRFAFDIAANRVL